MKNKKQHDVVSIIVPCYNGEKFIDRCFRSIFIQEYPCIELIVVDDGSTDNSKQKICLWEECFRKKGWILKYYYQENKGLGGAINAGLKLVSGEYISLLDVDDEYLPQSIMERVRFLEDNSDIAVVRSNGWVVKGEHKYLFVNEQKEKEIENVFLALLKGETNNWAGSYMVRTKELFEFYPEREIYQSKFGQNLQFLLPLVYKKTSGYIDKPHMNYIRQSDSLSQTSDVNNAEKKDIENAEGYKDIRIHMLNLIVKNENEKKEYMKAINGAYWKNMMLIGLEYKNKTLMRQAYQKMKIYRKPFIEDKIIYATLLAPFFAFILRGFRKIRNLIKIRCVN